MRCCSFSFHSIERSRNKAAFRCSRSHHCRIAIELRLTSAQQGRGPMDDAPWAHRAVLLADSVLMTLSHETRMTTETELIFSPERSTNSAFHIFSSKKVTQRRIALPDRSASPSRRQAAVEQRYINRPSLSRAAFSDTSRRRRRRRGHRTLSRSAQILTVLVRAAAARFSRTARFVQHWKARSTRNRTPRRIGINVSNIWNASDADRSRK